MSESAEPPQAGDHVHSAAWHAARDVLVAHLEGDLARQDWVASVQVVPDEDRWLVRLAGEEKDWITIWFTLRHRHLFHETGFMPAPAHSAEQVWVYLLGLNHSLVKAHFAVGRDGAVYLVGAVPVEWVTPEVVDGVVGAVYETVENHFRTAMQIGYPSFRRN